MARGIWCRILHKSCHLSHLCAENLQLEKYHEQAQLLDPHVGAVVDRLTAVIRAEALSGSEANWEALRQASSFLWALVTVR